MIDDTAVPELATGFFEKDYLRLTCPRNTLSECLKSSAAKLLLSHAANRRLDIIEGKMFDYLERNKDLQQDVQDELDFWKDLRSQIKRENKIDV